MGGWHRAPTYAPTSIIWVYLCKYAYEHIAAQFYTIKLVRFLGKKFVRNTKISYEPGQTPLRQTKVSEVKHFLEGSGHPNFMNPFECGKSPPEESD